MASESDSPQPICPYITGNVTRYCTLTPFTLTDAEREAITRAIAAQEHRAADMHPRSWIAADIDDDCDTLRGLLERTQ